MKQLEIKPNKEAFITKNVVLASSVSIVLISLIATLLHFAFSEILNMTSLQTILYTLILIIILNIIIIINANIRYKKEKYIIQKNKIIIKKGTIFTDSETELVIKNITQVWLNLPFLETRIFETGNLKIKAAGSGDIEIYMSAIDNPKRAYEYIKKIMEDEGFELTKKKLIQKEKPNTIAVFFEVFSHLIAAIFGFLVFIIFLIAPMILDYPNILPYVIIIGIIVLISAIISFILKFMNLKKRVYYLYEDVIDYEDGFLTENHSFIPIENLADTEITQTLIDKIFDLNDVVISSQGSQNNIAFTNMANGKKFKNNLDELIRNTPTLIDREKRKEEQKTITTKNKIEKTIKQDKKTTKQISPFTLEMDMMRSIIAPIIYIAILLAIILIITTIISLKIPEILIIIPIILIGAIILMCISTIPIMIQVAFTKYYVNSKSIEETFSFLTTRTKEFTNEKITRIKIHESFIDKMLGTISIEFNSIGSGDSITFNNIKKQKNLINTLLQITNIEQEKPKKQLTPKFSLTEFFKANTFLTMISLVILTTSIILGIMGYTIMIIFTAIIITLYIISYIQRTIYYKTAKLNLYENYIFYTRGILFRTDTYALYQNIKDIETKKYPASKLGKITFNIAGEIIQQTKNGQSARSLRFFASYMDEIEQLQNEIDKTMLSHPLLGIKKDLTHIKEPFTKNIKTTKPSKKNYITTAIMVSILFPPAILLLPITLLITYTIINKISYVIKPARIEKKSGVFYKKKLTILYNRFDHISMTRIFLNKVYKNGNVIIYTTGSSMPELKMQNITDYKEVYKIMEDNY